MNISYKELADCQLYAEHVLNLYKHTNNGSVPESASEAETAVREYNKEWRRFKDMFGYSIRWYIPVIVECIGYMVEQ